MPSFIVNRRRFVKVTTALSAASLLPASIGPSLAQGGLTPVRYLTPFGFLIGFAETLYGQAGGFFAKQGLDVIIEGGRGSAMSVQQVMAGNVLLSRTGGSDLIKAYARDPSVVAIAEIFQRDIFYVISDKDKPVRTPEDMAGKTIGIVSTGGATENILDMMLAARGVPAAEVRRETVGNAPAAFEFVKLGRIDAHIATNDTLFLLRAERQVLAWSTDTVAPCPGQVYITSKTALAQQTELLVGFLRGVQEALGAMLAQRYHLRPVVDAMTARYDVVEARDRDKGVAVLANSLMHTFRKPFEAKLASNPASWTSAYELMVNAKIIPPLDERGFYDDTARKLALG